MKNEFRDGGLSLEQTGNTQYPSFDRRHNLLGGRKIGVEEGGEAAVAIGAPQPGCDAVGVMLIAGSVHFREITAPQGGVDLGDG